MLTTALIRSSKRSSLFTVSTLLTALLAASFVVLVGESPARAAACTSGVMPSGNGQSATPYLIATPQNLIWMSEQTANWNNQHFRQTASIDLEGCQFTPIGKNTTAHFKGTYDGRGFTISGLYIRETTGYAGLFGDMNETAVFKNIGLVDVDIETTSNSAGALAGRLTGNNARVFNSYSTGRVVGGDSIGGLVGVLWGGGNISNSYSTASVTVSINNGRGGGLVGSVVTSGAVTNVYAAGAVRMASGFTSTNIGGLIGYPGPSASQPTETAAFFDSDVSAFSNSIGTGQSTSQMTTRATFSPAWAIFDGWEAFNFAEPGGTNYWGICPAVNDGYPFLLWEYGTNLCVLASAPSISSITPASSSGSLSVAFTAPTLDGGFSVTNYKYSTDNGATWITRSPEATTSPLVIQGLTNGTSYQVKLLAVNSQGDGTASSAVSGTPVAPPSPSSSSSAPTPVVLPEAQATPKTMRQPTVRPASGDKPARLVGKSLGKDVFFVADSAKLSPAAKKTLRQAARLAIASGSKVAVTGFAAMSSKGSSYEKAVAQRRALAVARYLRSRGVATDIHYHGLSGRAGLAFEGQPRRVEIRTLK